MRENGHDRSHWDRFWSSGRRPEEIYSTGDRIARALDGLFEPSGKRVLEVGAGTGRDSLRFAQGGALVVTLDYSRPAIELIREQARKSGVRLYPVLADAFRMPFRPGTFDLVFHQGLLEHFREPLPLLKANAEALRPGGLLLVDVPQKFHLYTLVKHALMLLGRWFAGWETEFTIGELEDLVRRAGLVPISRYGDWMRPSFLYRAARGLLLPLGIRLPMYPRGLPGIRDLRRRLREWARTQPWAFYTFLDIGVVARRPLEKGGENGQAVRTGTD